MSVYMFLCKLKFLLTSVNTKDWVAEHMVKLDLVTYFWNKHTILYGLSFPGSSVFIFVALH